MASLTVEDTWGSPHLTVVLSFLRHRDPEWVRHVFCLQGTSCLEGGRLSPVVLHGRTWQMEWEKQSQPSAVRSACDYNWVGRDQVREDWTRDQVTVKWALSPARIRQARHRKWDFSVTFFSLPDGKDLKVVEGELTLEEKTDEIKICTSFCWTLIWWWIINIIVLFW